VRERSGDDERQIVGREAELAALRGFLGGHAIAFVLSGGPGIGKTTLWEGGIAAARAEGLRVLVTRASSAEAQLSFAALSDLLNDVDEELGLLPVPQRHALEVALLRAEPFGAPPEQRAIALGFLNSLRSLSEHGAVLVAIDDVQWLDPASAEVLVFAARRLERADVRFLIAKRPARATALERALEPRGIERADVGPLSLGAIRRLLSERLGLSLPRHVLRRLVDATLGTPCSRSSSAGRWPSAARPRSARTSRSRTAWRRSWERESHGWERPCGVCCSPSRWTES